MDKIDLIRDFIDIESLPLQAIKDIQYFEYAASEYGILDEWNSFIDYVEKRFGSRDKYREYYNQVKESFLKYVNELPEFINFSSRDMSVFNIDFPEKNMIGENQYCESNVGKTLLSIDLKKANYQALKYVGIFKDTETYEELIGRFTDVPFIINSKKFRSLVFGQLNPKRHKIIENWLINMIRSEIPSKFKLICISNDELVYEIPSDIIILKSDLEGTIREIKELYGLDIKAEYYKLNQFIIEFLLSKKQFRIYQKKSYCGEKDVYKCIPNNLWLIFHKLLTNQELCEYDTWVEHEGILSKYLEPFKLIRNEKIISS
jgi:hypothetical protein